MDQIAIMSCDLELSTTYRAGIGGGYSRDNVTQTLSSIRVRRCNGTIASVYAAGIGCAYSIDGPTSSIDYIQVTDGDFTERSTRGACIGGGMQNHRSQSIDEIKISNCQFNLTEVGGAGIGLECFSSMPLGTFRLFGLMIASC
jgi:hypothetical protein